MLEGASCVHQVDSEGILGYKVLVFDRIMLITIQSIGGGWQKPMFQAIKPHMPVKEELSDGFTRILLC